MARRIRDPAEIEELKEFGEFFIEVDFQKKGLKMAELARGDAKEGCYEERKNLGKEFCGSWVYIERGRS